MSINTREELEEERRLFYVAVTRAKSRLWLSHATTRYRFGNLVKNDPSRFLEELPEQYLDKSFAGRSAQNISSGLGSAYERMHRSNGGGSANASYSMENKTSKPAYLPSSTMAQKVVQHEAVNFLPSDTSNLQQGQKVEHQKFGFGTVAKMEGSQHNPIATIVFEHNGEKKIMLNYAKLRILE